MSQNKPEISFEVKDNDSGVNESTVTLKIDNSAVSGLSKSAIEGGRVHISSAIRNGRQNYGLS